LSLKQIYLLLKKDLMVEVRRWYEVTSLVAFPMVSTLAFGYAYYGTDAPTLPFALLWITLLFTVVFTTVTSFIREAERKTIYGLKTLPCSPLTLYLSKFLYTFFLNTIIGLTIILLIHVFIGLQTLLIAEFHLLFLVELACLSAVSSFASALTMYSEGKTLLLPFLLFFFSLPSVTTAIIASENLVLGLNYAAELSLIAVYAVLMFILSTLLIDYLLED